MIYQNKNRRRLQAQAVTDLDVADALFAVESSGVADILEEHLDKRRGRPRLHSWKSILTLLVLSALRQGGDVHVVHALYVYWGLTDAQKERLGITREVKHSTLDYYLNTLADATQEHVDKKTGEITMPLLPYTLEYLTNRLYRAVADAVAETSDQAIDSMPVFTFARRRGYKKDLAPMDEFVDYGELNRTANARRRISEPGFPIDHGNGDYQPSLDPDARDTFVGAKNLAPATIQVGFDLHVSCDVASLGCESVPQIPRGFVLRPGNARKDDALLTLVDTMQELGSPIDMALIDRGYSQIPSVAHDLGQRGIDQTIKLKEDQMGPGDKSLPGVIVVDGMPYVSWMPRRLRKLPPYALDMTAEEKVALMARYDERIPYQFTRKGDPDLKRGTQQYRGPAVTGKVGCANTPGGMRTRRAINCPSVAEFEAGRTPKPCACGTQPTLGPHADRNIRQPYPFGSTKWFASYSRRSAIEGNNANLTTQFANLGSRKSIRVTRSIAKRIWLTCFGMIGAVVRIIRSRYETSPSEVLPGERLRTPVPKQRRFTSEGELKRALHERVFKNRKPRSQKRRRVKDDPPNKPTSTPRWLRTIRGENTED